MNKFSTGDYVGCNDYKGYVVHAPGDPNYTDRFSREFPGYYFIESTGLVKVDGTNGYSYHRGYSHLHKVHPHSNCFWACESMMNLILSFTTDPFLADLRDYIREEMGALYG